jgi:hypothetical protein
MRCKFQGHMTMTPRRTGRAPSHGKDRASAANANTTERSANLLETSFSITDEASPCSLSSTNSSRSVRARKGQCGIEGERVLGIKSRVVCHCPRAGVRSAAHIEFHTRYCFVAGGTGESCQRVLIPTSGPTTMRDEVHGRTADVRGEAQNA